MRVLLISGSAPPMKCGVGDYTALLTAGLSRVPGLEVGLLTSRGTDDCSGVAVFRAAVTWNAGEGGAILAAVRDFNPDLVHIQYPTLGYGTSKFPVLLPCLLQRAGFPVVQTWHEVIRGARCLRYLPAALCNDALTVIEEDYQLQTQSWFWKVAARKRQVRIPIGSNIPYVPLEEDERIRMRTSLVGSQKHVIAYFGFAHPSKGIEQLFDIADPQRDHLLLICDLDPGDAYHATILKYLHLPEWQDKVTVTGYQDHKQVARLLASADAAVFPFVSGATPRNASVMAAACQGTFVVTTAVSEPGYRKNQHVWYARPGDVDEMRRALDSFRGVRSEGPSSLAGNWEDIVDSHVELYRAVLDDRAGLKR